MQIFLHHVYVYIIGGCIIIPTWIQILLFYSFHLLFRRKWFNIRIRQILKFNFIQSRTLAFDLIFVWKWINFNSILRIKSWRSIIYLLLTSNSARQSESFFFCINFDFARVDLIIRNRILNIFQILKPSQQTNLGIRHVICVYIEEKKR